MTLTLAPDARRSVGLFSTGLTVENHKPKISFAKSAKSEKTVLNVSDIPVFRSGTFRDSMGYQHTWENIHIDQMVMHYDHLKSSGVFADVPVRKGHGSFFGDPMDSLIGWHTGLRAETMTSTHDGKEYMYLLASYEIFDEAAARHVEDGDWRNRSSEVGFYLTNAEAEYWPVYQGFAYVDIPAVEGLNGFSKAVQSRSNFSMMIEQEISMTDEEKAAAEKAAAEKAAADEAAAKAAADKEPEGAVAPEAGSAPAQEAAATPVVQPVEPVAAAHGTANAPQAFSINGTQTTDFSAVQAHITALETANVEREKVVRGDFIKQLASDGKISAVQIDKLTNHAQGLSPESYAAWASSYDEVPASGLFGQYGTSGGESNAGTTGGQAPVSASEIQTLEGVVAMHSRTMTQSQLESTDSFKKLAQLRAAEAQN